MSVSQKTQLEFISERVNHILARPNMFGVTQTRISPV